MKNLKYLKHFELLKIDASYNTVRVRVQRHNAKYNDNVRLTKINNNPYVYRNFFDIKEVDHNIMYTLIDQLKNSLEKIKIFESDEDIL